MPTAADSTPGTARNCSSKRAWNSSYLTFGYSAPGSDTENASVSAETRDHFHSVENSPPSSPISSTKPRATWAPASTAHNPLPAPVLVQEGLPECPPISPSSTVAPGGRMNGSLSPGQSSNPARRHRGWRSECGAPPRVDGLRPVARMPSPRRPHPPSPVPCFRRSPGRHSATPGADRRPQCKFSLSLGISSPARRLAMLAQAMSSTSQRRLTGWQVPVYCPQGALTARLTNVARCSVGVRYSLAPPLSIRVGSRLFHRDAGFQASDHVEHACRVVALPATVCRTPAPVSPQQHRRFAPGTEILRGDSDYGVGFTVDLNVLPPCPCPHPNGPSTVAQYHAAPARLFILCHKSAPKAAVLPTAQGPRNVSRATMPDFRVEVRINDRSGRGDSTQASDCAPANRRTSDSRDCRMRRSRISRI